MKTTQPRLNHGFSLIEIAIVLVIISVLVSIVAVPLSTQVEQRRREETSKQLEVAKEAVIGFALANGRLPCPALNTAACTTGRECFCSEQTGTSGSCTVTVTKPSPYIGRCAAFGSSTTSLSAGFLPAATLGITPTDGNGYALDGFNSSVNLIYYAVARNTVGTVDFVLTRDDGIKTATMSSVAAAPSLLTVCPTSAPSCSSANAIAPTAPFILFSLGANAATAYASLSAAEQANLDNDMNHRFVSGNKASDFDDILTWGSLNTIFARMVQAGKLP